MADKRQRLKAKYANQPLDILRGEYRQQKELRDRHRTAGRDSLAAAAQMAMTVITEEVDLQKKGRQKHAKSIQG